MGQTNTRTANLSAERKPWTPPRVEHLASSEAELGAGLTPDSEGSS